MRRVLLRAVWGWLLLASLAVVGAGAAAAQGGSGEAGLLAPQIAERDEHVARNENLLNAYRCAFGTDVALVPGGCDNRQEVPPSPVPENPTLADLASRDELIAAQVTLLESLSCASGIVFTADRLPIDPAVQVGILDNGLTFYVRSNQTPGSSLSLRLAVNAGSLNEPVVGAGYAHFLEHIVFGGSTEKYPNKEAIQLLTDVGLVLGQDFNAYTSYDETVYLLDVVIDDEADSEASDSVAAAFDVLSQWAYASTIDPAEVENEKGIVRDEYRLRVETGEGTVFQAFDDIYIQDTPYEGRSPIGTDQNIAATTAADLRNFYETWYVPSNMAVVVVGDLPSHMLQVLVEKYFCAIPARESPSVSDNSSPLSPEPVFDVVTTPEQGYSYLSLDIRLPSWDPGTLEGDRQLWIEQMIAIMVDNRLQDGYEQGFLSQIDPTHWESFTYSRGLRYYGTNLRAEDYSQALTDYWSLLLSLAEHGFSEADLERAASEIRSGLESAVAAEPTTPDYRYVSRYAAHFLEGADIGTLAQRAERVNALLDEVGADELSDRYREILATSGPIFIAVGPDPSTVPSTEEMAAALAAVAPGELPPLIEEVDELLAVPDAENAQSAKPIRALSGALDDAYQWTFANGARVVYAYSDMAENQVLLRAESQGGWSTLEEGDRPLAERLAVQAVRNSGLGVLTPVQLSRYLDTRTAVASPFISEITEGVVGASDTDDVGTLFQLLHLYLTEARVDEQAFVDAISLGEIFVAQAASDPDWQEREAYLEARYGNAAGWFSHVPSQEALDALTPEALLGLYQARMEGVDDLVVVVVGDVDRDTVGELARTYVGTLPAGDADTFVDHGTSAPDGVVRREVLLGPDDRAGSATYFYEAPTFVTLKTEVAASVLEAILRVRLFQDVREGLGESYAASAVVGTNNTGVVAEVAATGAPEQLPAIEAEMARILAEVRAGQISQEEFEQGRTAVRDNYGYSDPSTVLNQLFSWVYGDGQVATQSRLSSELDALGLADVQYIARLLFNPDQHIEIVRVLP